MQKQKWQAAIKVFSYLGDKEKLVKIGDLCAEERSFEDAFRAYKLSGKIEKLNDFGNLCFKSGFLEAALESFTLADNKAMIMFINQNFKKTAS